MAASIRRSTTNKNWETRVLSEVEDLHMQHTYDGGLLPVIMLPTRFAILQQIKDNTSLR
jgi:hypothetical protein